MNNKDIIDYIMKTPYNTNPAILKQHLEEQDKELGVIPEEILSSYVKSVNNIPPDVNGNVQIELPNTGIDFVTDESLSLKNGVLSVNTTNQVKEDSTLPITSAAVFATVGNIEVLLKTI